MNTRKHPGVYVPPPLIYLAFFVLSFLSQRLYPLDDRALHESIAKAFGSLLLLIYLLLFISALRRFLLTKNTLVTIRPAHSLETSGIYSFTRNPMYLSLVFLYSGLGILIGNWWTLILLPVLIGVVQLYVINKEEQYLQDAFGMEYQSYKNAVRRWL
ncbi:MAG TPA: isoprenylcysteine carboxylmethyltransferase family protein [Flavisolibacter sp.]